MKEKNKKIIIKILYKNWFVFIISLIMIYLCFTGKINIDLNLTLSQGIVGLIGVFLGFLLSLVHDVYKESRYKRKAFNSLRNELVFNYNLLEGSKSYEDFSELRVSTFEKMFISFSFVGVPSKLQDDIYEVYTKIRLLKQRCSDFEYSSRRKEVRSEINDVIKSLDEHLKNVKEKTAE